ncbi:MAG: tRNA (mnm(5)s(2)U34)-methyltransferase [Arenicella sp.]
MNLTKHAHKLIDEHFATLKDGIFLAIDATCGNGGDSVFLAQRSEKLLCFDIQHNAIKATQQLLSAQPLPCHVEYILNSHAHLLKEVQLRQHPHDNKINSGVDVIMFNLGFLPKSQDLSITTTRSSTLKAVKQGMTCLSERGVISILCYRGHQQGPEEFNAVKQFLDSVDAEQWQTSEYLSANPTQTTPILLFIHRKSFNHFN